LETLDRLDYVFLLLEPGMSDDLYLLARDYAIDRDTPLRSPFGSHRINPQHRLAILVDADAWLSMAEDLRELLAKVFRKQIVSGHASPTSEKSAEPRIFKDIDAVIRWCQRYYSNGSFLFRGQVRDWGVKASLFRSDNEETRRKWAESTEAFVGWLSGDNPLL